jgi:hypothetical protein
MGLGFLIQFMILVLFFVSIRRRTEPKFMSWGVWDLSLVIYDLDYIFLCGNASEDGTPIHELRSLGILGCEFSYL